MISVLVVSAGTELLYRYVWGCHPRHRDGHRDLIGELAFAEFIGSGAAMAGLLGNRPHTRRSES